MKLFAGLGMENLTKKVCDELGCQPGNIEITKFSDGEKRPQIFDSVRGQNIYVIQSTHQPDENLIALLLIINTLKLAGAKFINIIIPYLGYSRQDRKDKPRVPISASVMASIIEHMGASNVICCDLHANAIQGFFKIPTDHIYGSLVLIPRLKEYFKKNNIRPEGCVVVAPDKGAFNRNSFYARKLGIPRLTFLGKRTVADNQKEVGAYIEGEVPKGATCFIFDDMIDTAGTIVQAAEIAKEKGAGKVVVSVTHFIASGPAVERLKKSPIDTLFVTDSIPQRPEINIPGKLEVVSLATLLARVIQINEAQGSVNELFQKLQ